MFNHIPIKNHPNNTKKSSNFDLENPKNYQPQSQLLVNKDKMLNEKYNFESKPLRPIHKENMVRKLIHELQLPVSPSKTKKRVVVYQQVQKYKSIDIEEPNPNEPQIQPKKETKQSNSIYNIVEPIEIEIGPVPDLDLLYEFDYGKESEANLIEAQV